MPFTLTSSALTPGHPIPVRYTCDGANVSPPLAWTDPPAGTRAFLLVVDDPDAPSGTFTHWMLSDISADAHVLDEGAGAAGIPGRNDFGRIGYGGPCPPKGHGAHRYRFQLYALRGPLKLRKAYSREDLDTALDGQVLASALLQAPYERRA